MPSVSVLVPLASDHDSTRDHNWSWLRKHWSHHHPDWQLCEGRTQGTWCKADAVNAAAQNASGDLWVISDADLLVDPDDLRAAVTAALSAPWVVPVHNLYRLTPEATADHLGTNPEDSIVPPRTPAKLQRAYVLVPGGGIFILPKETYETVGGFDPRFKGWGGEDRSLGHALETLVGEPVRVDGEAWHLWHRPSWPKTQRMSDGNDRLARLYISARGNPESMSLLTKEHANGDSHQP